MAAMLSSGVLRFVGSTTVGQRREFDLPYTNSEPRIASVELARYFRSSVGGYVHSTFLTAKTRPNARNASSVRRLPSASRRSRPRTSDGDVSRGVSTKLAHKQTGLSLTRLQAVQRTEETVLTLNDIPCDDEDAPLDSERLASLRHAYSAQAKSEAPIQAGDEKAQERAGQSEQIRAILNKSTSLRFWNEGKVTLYEEDAQVLAAESDSDSDDESSSGQRKLERSSSIGRLMDNLKSKGEEKENNDIDARVLYMPPWTIDPFDSLWWVNLQKFLVLTSIAVGLVAPFDIAFLDADNLLTPTKIFLYSTDGMFLVDFILMFFVPKFDDGEWKVKKVDIALSYAQGQLWYDLVATVPWSLAAHLILQPKTEPEMLTVSMLGFLRLLRIKKLWTFFWQAGTDFRYNYFNISIQKFSFLTLFSLHWAACVFFLIARVDDFADYTWVAKCAAGLDLTSLVESYVTSLYWAMTTLSTVGYGDLSAYTIPERIWTVGFMGLSMALTAYVIGNITVLLSKADAAMADYRDKLTSVASYMSAHQVPSNLQKEVQAHLKLQFETEAVRDDILKTCPPNVRTRVARHVYAGFISQPYLFKGTSDMFRDQLATRCREEFFLPNVEILRAGDTITDMYIIASGSMKGFATDASGRKMAWLDYTDGSVVGEFAFMCDQSVLWSVKTTTTCRVLCISRDDYQSLAQAQPADNQQVVTNLAQKTRALARLAESNALGKRSQSKLVGNLAKLLQNEVESFRDLMTQETVMRLCYAARRGDVVELYRLCSRGFDINTADYDGRTALHLASFSGQDKAVQFLLDRGADVNAQDAFQRTPLYEAVSTGNWSTAKLLRRFGGEMRIEDEGTQLCKLASQGDAAQVKRLLQFGADPNAVDYDGRSPLHVAVSEGHLSVVKALVEGGASPEIRDRFGTTPLDEAKRGTNSEIILYLSS